MKLIACALLIGFGAAGAVAAPVTPYDFTGHWSGQFHAGPQTGAAFADFSGTQTFTGTIGVEVGQLLTCSVQGKQKKKVKMNLTCSDGSKVKLVKGVLDPTARALSGKFHVIKKGRSRGHGTYMLASPGTCVPTGQDCTDPATGGGEAAVCCGGDCSMGVDGNGNEIHTCD